MWQCIDSLKKEESLIRCQTEQLIAENVIGVKRKYKDRTEQMSKKNMDVYGQNIEQTF